MVIDADCVASGDWGHFGEATQDLVQMGNTTQEIEMAHNPDDSVILVPAASDEQQLPQAEASCATPQANNNILLDTGVPLVLQLSLSGAIKILAPSAPPTAESRILQQQQLAFKFYYCAMYITYAFDAFLVFYLIAYYSGLVKPSSDNRAAKGLMVTALFVGFTTATFGAILNLAL